VLHGLGFDDARLDDGPSATLSGGWKMPRRVAKVLSSDPTVDALD